MNQKENLDKEKMAPSAIVHALSHDGRGIATIDQKTTFIAGALPGETVTYRLTQKHSNYMEAKILDVLHAGESRVSPPCQHFGLCGGCSLQHMSAEVQIQLKQQTLLDQLKHFGKVEPQTILAPLNAETTGYRRKARLGVKFVIKKDKVLVGFREKSSRYLAELERCAVLHPIIGERLETFASLVASLEQKNTIPQIEVAIGDTDVALVFRHMEDLSLEDKERLIHFGKMHHFHIYLQPNPPGVVEKIWPDDSLDRLTYTLPDEGLEFLFHPLDFTQINLEINRLMVAQAMRLLDLQSEDEVLDLFCGIGNFTLPIARRVRSVTGIEGGQEMVERATANAAHNHIHNAEFYTANLMDPPATASWMKKRYDKVLLDPPRVGAKEILPYFKHFAPQKIVYVSCNPATLARDAGFLVHECGYQLQQAGIMNMFPHTSHIEAMAVLTK